MIGLAHGSRHTEGAAAIERLTAAVAGPRRPARHAFLDLAAPDLETSPPSWRRPATAGPWWCRCCSPWPSTPPSTCPRPYAPPPSPPGSSSRWPTSSAPGTTSLPCCYRPGRRRGRAGASVLLYAVGLVQLRRQPGGGRAGRPAGAPIFCGSGVAPRGRRGRSGRPFATCAREACRDAGPELPEPVAILPLFLADGLLLDPARTLPPAAAGPWSSRWGSGPPDSSKSAYRAVLRSHIGFSVAIRGARRAALPADGPVRGLRGQDRRVRPGPGRRQPRVRRGRADRPAHLRRGDLRPAWQQMFDDPELELALASIVHGDQRFDYRDPLRAGEWCRPP